MTGELVLINDNNIFNVDKNFTASNVNDLVKEIENTESLEKMEEYKKGLKENATQRRRKNRICYFCRKPGHFINNCPERRETGKPSNCRVNNVSLIEGRRMNEYNRYENLKRRDHDYLKVNNRCKNETNNWRNTSYKDEPKNWREMCSLKSDEQIRIFDDANWRKRPERKIVQRGRMCEDSNWRERPVPESDQCGQMSKDANWRQMSLEADKISRNLKDVRCVGIGMDRDVQ
jgi:hypothetical protein